MVEAAAPSEIDSLAMRAAEAGEVALLRLLLQQQQQPPWPLPVLNRLLLAAVCADQDGCAALMLGHGASPNATSPCGAITALQRAVQHKEKAMAHRLLAACADVMAVDENGQTALHHAARAGGDNSCLAALLRRSMPDDDGDGESLACGVLDVWGRTPLHWAVISGHREAVVSLVDAGSDISLRDRQNESSLDLAERRAVCHAISATGKCDRLTVNLLRLMLPPGHDEHSSFHPEGFMDLCTYEVLGHATRLLMSPDEREALLAMTPQEREAIGDHVMTIDELNARSERRAAAQGA